MSTVVRPRRAPHRLGVSVPAVVGRLRADRWPLLLMAAVVCLATALAVGTPRLVGTTADDAVRDAVTRAAPATDLEVRQPIGENPYEARRLDPYLAQTTVDLAGVADGALPPVVAEVHGAPVTTVATSGLVSPEPRGDLVDPRVQMVHLWRDGPPLVEWVAGGPPSATVTPAEAADLVEGGVWPVEVGLSTEVAAALEMAVGDRWELENENESVRVDLVVSGVFRPTDPAEPVWSRTPGLLEPRVVGTTVALGTQVAGLLSDDSLPVAVLAMPSGTTSRTVTFVPEASTLHAGDAVALASEITGMKTTAPVGRVEPLRARTQLDTVLLDVHARIGAATAQASVLLGGMIALVLLTLLLAARLVAHRRAVVLGTYRARGATLGGVAVELAAEAALVTAVGGAAGISLADAVAPGAAAWTWLIPVAVVAVVGGPVLGVRAAARATATRRPAVDHHERRMLDRDRTAGRVTVVAGTCLVAAGAVTALRSRGVATGGGVDPLLALAPTVAALAGGLVLLHLLPLLLSRGLRTATRSRRVLPVLAVARARTSANQVLPFLTLTVAVALTGLGASVAATIHEGEVDGSWTSVGADVTLASRPDPGLADAAEALLAYDGVRSAVTGRVEERVNVFGDRGGQLARVVALPSADYARFLAQTPLPDAPELSLLAADGADEPLPVLVSPDLRPGDDESLTVLWDDVSVDARAVGTAPWVLAQGGVTVVVDADALAARAGQAVEPDRLWVAGPGAEDAVAAMPELAGAEASTRSAWLAQHRSGPLPTGVLRLAEVGTALLLLLTALAVVLGSSADAPQRGRTLAVLRTLGIDGGDARRISLGELLPGICLAVAGGVLIGVGLAAAVTGPLGLRLVTGQVVDPRTVVPWTVALPGLVALVTVVVLVLVESSLRRRERLGEVLRVGGVEQRP